MAEEVTEKQQIDVETKPEIQPAPPKSRGGLWMSLVLLLMIFLLAGAGYYLLNQLDNKLLAQSNKMQTEDQRVIELTKQITQFQTQFTDLQTRLTAANAEATSSDESYNQKLAEFSQRYDEKLASQHQAQQEVILRLQRQLGKTRGDWLLADAEYLLSIAGQRLHLTGDLNTTAEALKAASQRLRESGDGAEFKIREQIAKELAAVEAIKNTDIVGTYSTLQVLIERIEKLALLKPYAGKPLTDSQQVHSHQSKVEHGLLDSALKQVEGFVTIRHLNQAVDDILTPQQAIFIRQQLSIKLEMVKIALVQKNTALYSKSIEDALRWIKLNFTKNNEAKDFIAQLKELDRLSIDTKQPDISLSLKMLRDITKLRIETDKALDTTPETQVEAPKVDTPVVDEATKIESTPVPNSTKESLGTDSSVEKTESNPVTTAETVDTEKPEPTTDTSTVEIKPEL